MFEFLRRSPRPAPSIDDTLWRNIVALLPWARGLEATRQQRLRELTATFLRDKTIITAQGLNLEPVHHGMLASLCCLPLLEFGSEGLHGWSRLLVHPEMLPVDMVDVDEDEVQHEWEEHTCGLSHDSGIVVVSWNDVLADCAEPNQGNVALVHEMAHKLDLLDSVMDGTPPLPREWQALWAHDFQLAYDAFAAHVDHLHARDDEQALTSLFLKPNAADSPEEFFAVVSEYHFSIPALLRDCMPEVAAHLRQFYGRSPFE